MDQQQIAEQNRRRLKILATAFVASCLIIASYYLLLAAGASVCVFAMFAPGWYPWVARKWPRDVFHRASIVCFVVIPLLILFAVFTYLQMHGREIWGLGVWGFLWSVWAAISIGIASFLRRDDPDLAAPQAAPPTEQQTDEAPR